MKESFNEKDLKIEVENHFWIKADRYISKNEQSFKKSQTEQKGQEELDNKREWDEEKYDYFEEVQTLLENKKGKLIDKFEELMAKYRKFGKMNIYDIILKVKEESFSEIIDNNKEIKNEKCIYFLGGCFFTFYLIGLFQLLNLFDACKTEFGIVFKSYIYKKNKDNKSTFKDLYIISSIKKFPEFDFVFITSIIGSLPLQLFGFFITSLLFTALNAFLCFNFMDLNLDQEKYEFKDFIAKLL